MNMNIIWLTTQFPNGTENKNGMFIFRTVNALSKFHSISVLNLYPRIFPVIPIIKNFIYAKKILAHWLLRYPRNPIPPKNISVRVDYAKYFRLPRNKFHFLEGRFAYWGIKKYISHLLDRKTIFHANWMFPEGDLANILYKKYKIPFVVTLMGSDVHYLKQKSKKWYKAMEIIKNASFITSVSKQLYVDLENKSIIVPEEKRLLTHTIYEFDDFKIFDKNYARKKINLNDSDKIIFFAGTLRDIKNVNVLILSFSQLLSSNSSAKKKYKLIIAGKGEEEGNLKSLAIKLNVHKNIQFVGGLNSEEIIDYYNAADVFCLPSQNEGLPNVVVEALLCGVPVVASEVGEIPFLINEDRNGYLVKPNDSNFLTNQLEKALLKTWDREELRKSVNFLNPESVLSEYKLLYSKMEISLSYD